MAEKDDNKVIMTLNQYILNPMGKNNAVLNGGMRELMRKTYMNKFDNIMLREKGIMTYHLYKDEKKNQYWAHIKVPSEVVNKFYYDVVFKFYIDASKGGENDLFDWNIQFFSNDPAFVYTYAYVFAHNELFIPELKSKMSKIALKEAPKEKNPQYNVGYVKAIYFAYLLMQNRKFNKINRFESECTPLVPQMLLADIANADDKVRDRQEEEKNVSHRKKKNLNRDLARAVKSVGGKDLNMSRYNVRTTKKVGTIKSGVKMTKTVKKK